MEKKRYQIFLSSTFTDLEEERRKVMQAMLGMDCIPSGMEYFPASDEETFEFIKTVIDESDYYILILAGRYGSIDADGVSYTEKEYDYALKQSKPILSFLRKDLSKLTLDKIDKEPDHRPKLEEFRKKILGSGRLVKQWSNADQLAADIVLTLTHAIKRYPQPGWIRGDRAASADLLETLNNLRIENEGLKKREAPSNPKIAKEGLLDLEGTLTIPFRAKFNNSYSPVSRKIDLSLGEILRVVGFRYRTASVPNSHDDLRHHIAKSASALSVDLDYEITRDIITQFEILGILTKNTENGYISYVLSENGEREYLERTALRR
ncbi:DUF4062 domain-containing protein [Rhizobium lemnae]|uniref:DUF4062 domain-containing protein n=1 Tax=Rhizobium lemnae TaxID=1214924 RepID=A0ABV8E8D0_9HYPH|nr:DUF4062 domain-containing protein [Rhizobium lemnae]MCJ8509641.1 DUF4062 domain-containing protein [Rhizobium lemnae]